LGYKVYVNDEKMRWLIKPGFKAGFNLILMSLKEKKNPYPNSSRIFLTHTSYGIIAGGINIYLFDEKRKIKEIGVIEGNLISYMSGFIPSVLCGFFISSSLSSGKKNELSDYITLL